VRGAAFAFALAAAAFACADFWRRTRLELSLVRARRGELLAFFDESVSRAKRSGAPPAAAQLEAASASASALEQELSALRDEWYRGAGRPSDWLVPRAARAAMVAAGQERERVVLELVSLPADLKLLHGLSAARLGLLVPSLSEAFPSDARTLEDQSRRAVAARHLLAALRALGSVRVEHVALQGSPDAGLVLRLDALAALDDAVRLFEQLPAPSDDAPPRRLLRFSLVRLAPRDWGLQVRELPGPPVRVSIGLSFDFPATAEPDALGASR
jgi:hypothetical protein